MELGHDAIAWRGAETFRFRGCQYEAETGVASLVYAFDDGEPLIETITFAYAPWPPEASRQLAFDAALKLLHLIAGVSYFKASLPPNFARDHGHVSSDTATFLKDLYVNGLAEFAYLNKVDLASKVSFDSLAGATDNAEGGAQLVLAERALVAMGGGKDSIVALSMLQGKEIEVQPVCVGNSPLIEETVRAAGLPLLRIGRELAPGLAAMNQAGALNGHVPVTAINSAILLCAAILYGYKYVVFANERSADEETLIGESNEPVNHQYSKSSAFEASFRRVVARTVSPDIEYFSVLRPYAELDVVRRFCDLEKYHPVFSSCNRNFHIDGSKIEGRWCGECPKCRFAALALAVFLPPDAVRKIQGKDMLDDANQCDGFRALCRLGAEKPFECVGEAGECRAALAALARDEQWKDHLVVKALSAELAEVEVPELQIVLRPAGAHFIPAALLPDELADV